MARNKNLFWDNGVPDKTCTAEQASRAVLQDIRDELQTLVRIMTRVRIVTERLDKRAAKRIRLR